MPFVAVVEAYVLRSLRGYLSMPKIREAAEAVPLAFGDEYGLTTRRIATDGVDIFVAYADGGLARARDGQRPIREVITDYVRYIGWESGDQYPYRLCLRQYPDVAPVIIDPRFGWGASVVAENKAQVDAIVSLWEVGETLETVADEYGLTRDQVEAVCRTARRRAARVPGRPFPGTPYGRPAARGGISGLAEYWNREAYSRRVPPLLIALLAGRARSAGGRVVTVAATVGEPT
ncbi:DUF433 domain-containing protein [Streptomyces sp. SID8382]|nr:DUF433 domain-containing protein [Streptomyces sp. SID8382]